MFDKFKFLEIQFFFLSLFLRSALGTAQQATPHLTSLLVARPACASSFFSVFIFPLPKAGSAMEVFCTWSARVCSEIVCRARDSLVYYTSWGCDRWESDPNDFREGGQNTSSKNKKEFCAKRMKLSLESTHCLKPKITTEISPESIEISLIRSIVMSFNFFSFSSPVSRRFLTSDQAFLIHSSRVAAAARLSQKSRCCVWKNLYSFSFSRSESSHWLHL